jgi:hypothetical protein
MRCLSFCSSRCSPAVPAEAVPAVIPAEGALLDRVLSATYPIWHGGLSRHAYGRFYAALMKTAWGRRSQRQFALIAEEGITAAAYVVVSIAGRSWTLEECGDRDPSGTRVGALLQALIAREPVERRPAIRTWLPPRFVPPQVTVASTRPSTVVMKIRSLSSTAVPRLGGNDVLYWRNDIF